MITYERFEDNFNKFVDSLPTKPENYTPDYPLNLKEALYKYCRTRTVSLLEIQVNGFDDHNWPLPLFVNQRNIKVGFYNRYIHYKWEAYWKGNWKVNWKERWKLHPYDWLSIPFLRKSRTKDSLAYDKSISEMFMVNLKEIEKYLVHSSILKSKTFIIKEIFSSLKKEHWASCICTTFPILDFVSRQLLKTTHLTKDITNIYKYFSRFGLNAEGAKALTPFGFFVEQMSLVHDHGVTRADLKTLAKSFERRIGLPGLALRSFLVFANNYYGFYKEDSPSTGVFNRHAILHGSINDFATRVNAIKLLTFLYLMIELEPILSIIFDNSQK